MPPLRTDITRELLQGTYCDQKLSLTEIGRRLNCAGNTIAHHLRMHHIPVRTLSEASTRYVRRDFDGTEEQSAYLIGFRLGDLNARLITPAGHSIWLNSRTSRVEQVELFRALFGPYGHAYTA